MYISKEFFFLKVSIKNNIKNIMVFSELYTLYYIANTKLHILIFRHHVKQYSIF